MSKYGLDDFEYKIDTIKDDRITALMCPVCFEIIGTINQKLVADINTLKNGTNKKIIYNNINVHCRGECDKCHNNITEYINIDGDIAAPISLLNQKGWKTISSCSGNPENKKAYIEFKDNNYIKYIPIVPKGWRFDVSSYMKYKKYIFVSKYGEYNTVELYEWVKRLPIFPDAPKIYDMSSDELMKQIKSLENYE